MQSEIDDMRAALTAYIEATYHLSHPKTVAIRRQLLTRAGGISQEPYVESTPTYVGDQKFATMALSKSVKSLLTELANVGLLFDPPYQHQAQALEHVMRADAGGTGIVVTTGTGSGKTEAFLLPVLARLADEASDRPDVFKTRAVRALLLYPMNALVNDQLGRLRTLFGDETVRDWFQTNAGRPAKFGRYTGRTLYPGRRSGDRDKKRLVSLNYYLDLEESAHAGDINKADLVNVLKRKGRWPAKSDSSEGAYDGLRGWYGGKSTHWEDAQGNPRRAIERPQDSELLTRHEMQGACPDLLVTNYSMLEYMLLRPIERSLFDETRAYFEKNPAEKFVFVLDEAHLYRGANGTEVAYLVRRFLDRLNLDTSRVVFILTSASFSVPEAARQFAAQLIGVHPTAITVLNGLKRLEPNADRGGADVIEVLARTPLGAMASANPAERAALLKPLLAWRPLAKPEPVIVKRLSGQTSSVRVQGLDPAGQAIEEVMTVGAGDAVETSGLFAVVTEVVPANGSVRFGRPGGVISGQASSCETRWENDDLARAAWFALKDLPVVAALKNITSGAAAEADPALITGSAKSLSQLAVLLFGDDGRQSMQAIDGLLELVSLARLANDKSPLLPARIHLMFRGLPGLWACMDPQCSALAEHLRGGPTGALYAEPRRHCTCDAQVFELWSCRACGIAVAHAFLGSPAGEQHLWADDGGAYSAETNAVHEAYICLEAPGPAASTQLSAADLDVYTGRLDGEGRRTRPIWCDPVTHGVFEKCPRCDANQQISDLQTKGDEPFQQLIAVQVLSQPPRPESDAPLKGRKTLVFSDGRQTASRLAGLLKTFAFRDSVRPLVLEGMSALTHPSYKPSLDDAPLAVSLAAATNKVRLRPIGDDRGDFIARGRQAIVLLAEPDVEASEIEGHSRDTSQATPPSVFQSLYAILQDRHTGLSALALASLGPKLSRLDAKSVEVLPLPTVEGQDDAAVRDAVLRLWLWCALDRRSIKLTGTPADLELDRWSGKFGDRITRALKASGHATWVSGFAKTWVPTLRQVFSGSTDSTFHVSARKIALHPGGAVSWRRCGTCTLVSPDNLLLGDHCPACNGRTEMTDPEQDEVFRSRKAFFRRATERLAAQELGYAPHQLVAEEHSAQLNDSNAVRAMSRNEAYELRFQDVPVAQDGHVSDPIDVLSCTTTMEVGIDIGGLTAVALRNVPPGRANYQQRAGRAGRRGAGLSTVVMFCGADSHDQSFFRDPAPIVSGPAPDPVLNLNNKVIAERQAFAFLLGRFQQARVIASNNPNIFESLGSTHDFLTGDPAGFSLAGLKQWLIDNREILAADVRRLFTASCSAVDPNALLERWPMMLEETLGLAVAQVVLPVVEDDASKQDEDSDDGHDDPVEADAPDNDRSGAGSGKLLDQLFAFGLMPRYAFPTDVATFAVFEDNPDPYRPQLAYSPQQSLNAALAQYAPGRSVWIDGKTHISMGVWSAFDDARSDAYKERKLYYHCQICDFATLKAKQTGRPGSFIDCPACNTKSGMGPAQHWLRPVGFSHPPGMPPAPPRIDGTVNSRPTRAKLDAPNFNADLRVGGQTFDNQAGWEAWRENLDLVVTNRGTQSSSQQGFRHCPTCGRTEPADLDSSLAQLGPGSIGHARPRPTKPKEGPLCHGRVTSLVLGNQFKTDIAVLRLQAPPSWDLSPNRSATIIAAKSAVEALIRAASRDLEPGDIDGDYRFAPGRNANTLLDLYIYDQAAGGAGFVYAAAADPRRLVLTALQVLDDCTCEDSCYQCLRTYKNRFDHAFLDRRLGADLLRACFQGLDPIVSDTWAQGALTRLRNDVSDAGGSYDQKIGGLINAQGRAIVVGHPFRPDMPGNASAAKFASAAKTFSVVDVLMIDRGLPLATALVLDTSNTSSTLPPPADEGPLLLTMQEALSAVPPVDVRRVSVGAFEPGDFVLKLETHTLEGKYGDGKDPVLKGTYCLFRPTSGDLDPKQIYLLRRADGFTFGATHESWTVGSVQQVKNGIRVRYRARPERLECGSEVIEAGIVEPVAMFIRQVK